MRTYSSKPTNYIHWFVFVIILLGLLMPVIRIYAYGLNGAMQIRNNHPFQLAHYLSTK